MNKSCFTSTTNKSLCFYSECLVLDWSSYGATNGCVSANIQIATVDRSVQNASSFCSNLSCRVAADRTVQITILHYECRICTHIDVLIDGTCQLLRLAIADMHFFRLNPTCYGLFWSLQTTA